MLQNNRVTAFIFCELLRENQHRRGEIISQGRLGFSSLIYTFFPLISNWYFDSNEALKYK